MDTHVMVSVPITRWKTVSMRDLRDFIEATDNVPEDAEVQVLSGELRYEGMA